MQASKDGGNGSGAGSGSLEIQVNARSLHRAYLVALNHMLSMAARNHTSQHLLLSTLSCAAVIELTCKFCLESTSRSRSDTLLSRLVMSVLRETCMICGERDPATRDAFHASTSAMFPGGQGQTVGQHDGSRKNRSARHRGRYLCTHLLELACACTSTSHRHG